MVSYYSMLERPEYTPYEREQLNHIVATHNPCDPCQNVVRETALAALAGEIILSPQGLLFLTNGARGYNSNTPPSTTTSPNS